MSESYPYAPEYTVNPPGSPSPLAARTWYTGAQVTATALNDDYYRTMRRVMNRPAAGAWLSVDQTISHATYTTVDLDRVLFDTDGMFSEEHRGFVIHTPGTYEIQGYVRFDNPSAHELAARILVNGVAENPPQKVWSALVGTEVSPYAIVVTELALKEGDYVQLDAWQGTGDDWDLQGYDDPGYYGVRCHLSLYWTGEYPPDDFGQASLEAPPQPKTWTVPQATADDLNDQVRDIPKWLVNPPRAKISNLAGTDQTIPNASGTIVTFADQRYDTDDMVDLDTNNDRITFNKPGYYKVIAAMRWASTNSSGRTELQVHHYNSSDSLIRFTRQSVDANPYGYGGQHHETIVEAAEGDYISLKAYHSAASNATRPIDFAYMSARWVSNDETYGDDDSDPPALAPFLPGDVMDTAYWNDRVGFPNSWLLVPPAVFHCCFYEGGSPQTLDSGVIEEITWRAYTGYTAEFQTEKRADWGTGDLTIPSDGIYNVTYYCEAHTDDADHSQFLILVTFTRGSTTSPAITESTTNGGTNNDIGGSVSFVYPFRAGDALQFKVRHNKGSSMSPSKVVIGVEKISDTLG